MNKLFFSRHAKRRMKLYGIIEADVKKALREGEKATLPDGRISAIHYGIEKFKLPLKVVAVETDSEILVVTAYPLKKGLVNKQ